MIKKTFYILSLLVLTNFVNAQHAAEVNALIGKGVNGYKIISGSLPAWPDAYYDSLQKAGFNSVRIVFEENLNATINSTQLSTLKTIVDKCLSFDLFPVIDYHYTQWDTYTAAKGTLFITNWGLISNHFKAYTYDKVVFELSNEPFSKKPAEISDTTYNKLVFDLISSIRTYDADRVIMVSPLELAHINGLYDFYIPDDDNLILSIHYYNPKWVIYQNTGWDTLNNDPSGYPDVHWKNIQPMVDNLESEFEEVFTFQAANNNIPVCIGEWGSTILVDSLNRIKYATLLCRWFESKGFSHQVWEFNDWFGVMGNSALSPGDPDMFYPGLTEAITTTPLVLNTYDSTVIFEESGFGSVGSWITFQTGGGNVNIGVYDSSLVINVLGSDYFMQNARVYSPTFALYKDSVYRVTYDVWTAYGTKDLAHKYKNSYDWSYIYNLGTSHVTKVETYICPIETDLSSYFELLVGLGTGTLYLDNFKVELLTVKDSTEAEPEDTCAYHITLYDTINVADSALFLFENNLTAAYGDVTLTNHSTTYSTTNQCQGSYCVNGDVYLSWIGTSSIALADSFVISIYYRAWYNAGVILSNKGASGSGFALTRVTGNTITFVTDNGAGGTATLTSNAVISYGTCYLIEVRGRRSTGIGKIFIDGSDQTLSGTMRTDFSLTGTWGIGASNDGTNQSWAYLDQFSYKTFYSGVTETDSCVMTVEDTLYAIDTIRAVDLDLFIGDVIDFTYPAGACIDSIVTIDRGSAIMFDNVIFNNETYLLMNTYCDVDPYTMNYEVRIDSIDGQLISSIINPFTTGECIDIVSDVTPITGMHDLYIIADINDVVHIGNFIFYYLEPSNYIKYKPIYINADNHGVIEHNGRYYTLPNN
jgi:hypothetical protein